MRRKRLEIGLFSLATLFAATSCDSIGFLAGQCESEAIVVTWPTEITRGGLTVTSTLTSSVTPANLATGSYDQLRAALIDGTLQQNIAVTWTVAAFSPNGGYIALTHPYVITPSGSMPVIDGGTFGGWGTGASRENAVASVNTGSPAAVTSGTITTIGVAPARYRVVIDARDAAGAPIHIAGDASFSRRVERRACD